jgi:hypothetical protein
LARIAAEEKIQYGDRDADAAPTEGQPSTGDAALILDVLALLPPPPTHRGRSLAGRQVGRKILRV